LSRDEMTRDEMSVHPINGIWWWFVFDVRCL